VHQLQASSGFSHDLFCQAISAIMGVGGCIGIANASPFIWTQISHSSYQMNSWDFPTSIGPGQISTNYIEFDQGVFTVESDTSASVVFQLNTGLNHEIQINSEVGDYQNIYVQLSNTLLSDQDSKRYDLGFNHDGCVTLYLNEVAGSLYFNSAPIDWMHATLDTIGDKTLRQLAIPGAHDAGMGPDYVPGTFFSAEANIRTQELDISGQLLNGVRWFDIRPIISGGEWYTGHYGHNSFSGWQGGNGEVS
jgi:hypothetical protein